MEKTNRSIRARASSDRLSSLPDSVLCHILSFLRTKESVATSILARRWKFLWTRVPKLDFDIENPEIINRVLQLHNVRCLKYFHLGWRENYGEDLSYDQLESWISTAIARNVQALELYLDLSYELELPNCIFTCNTLVDLRISGGRGIPDEVCLPNLKKLHLHSVDVGETLSRLISGCQVLEDLYLFENEGISCCNISSPTIKWLALNNESSRYDKFKLDINNTPALRYLLLEDYLPEDISAGALDSLVEADIWFGYDRVKDDARYSRSVLEFVDKLCHVKCLILWTGYPKFLDSSFAAAAYTRFDNLTKLELSADWRFLTKFLEAADNLEVLVIKEVNENLKRWVEPEQVPKCLSSHLRQVTIDQIGCSEDEFKMISYILKNASVLNTMEISARYLKNSSDFDAKFNVLQRIHCLSEDLEHVSLRSFEKFQGHDWCNIFES